MNEQMTFLAETERLLIWARQNRISAIVIAENTGLNPQYVRRISRGDIENPGVRGLQLIHDYLVKRKSERTAAA